MFKRLVILALVLFISEGVVFAQSNRFGTCTPGYRTLNIAGTDFANVPTQCVSISRSNEAGYYPIGTAVTFAYKNKTFSGFVSGTQWTWQPDGTIAVQYMVAYSTDIGTDFSVKEVAIDQNLVQE